MMIDEPEITKLPSNVYKLSFSDFTERKTVFWTKAQLIKYANRRNHKLTAYGIFLKDFICAELTTGKTIK